MITESLVAVPERLGSEVFVGGWPVALVAAAHRFVVPIELVLEVLAVRNLPASAATCR